MRKILAALSAAANIVPVFAFLALAAVIGVALGHGNMYYA